MAKETRTYRDRAANNKMHVALRRNRLKKQMVEHKGGRCQICGYCKYFGALDFHHVDPTTRSFGLSKDELHKSWATISSELEKCILVCSNCHREIHAGLIDLSSFSLSPIMLK